MSKASECALLDCLQLSCDGSSAMVYQPIATHAKILENAMLNFNPKSLDELAARIGKAVEGSPVKDIEKNVKGL